MAVIRPYEPKDKENVRNVCLATGPANAYEPKERIFLLACFCDYYIEKEPELCFVVENAAGEAAGYIFCAVNYKSYRRVFKKEYVKRAGAAGLTKGLYALFTGVPLWLYAKKYPAHLHIDILPAYQRAGLGHRLMDALHQARRAMVEALKTPRHTVRIAMVGKYVALHDAYLSVVEALKHGGVPSGTRIEIAWVDSETVTRENARELLEGVHGILIPGGFGIRGVEGKIEVARFAREQRIPYLGICLGLQVAVIEFARNVAGLEGAHGIEFDPSARHPVIHLMPDQDGVVDLGGTLRLGSYPCRLEPGSKAYSIYDKPLIHERHRHRYEFNNAYRKALSDAGLRLCGLSPDGHIVEMVELPDHPWHVSVQFHPEFKSRPNRPHPLFRSFVEASLEHGNA